MNVPNIPPTIAISFNINNANIIPSHKSKPEDDERIGIMTLDIRR